jgi:hypothetical protein
MSAVLEGSENENEKPQKSALDGKVKKWNFLFRVWEKEKQSKLKLLLFFTMNFIMIILLRVFAFRAYILCCGIEPLGSQLRIILKIFQKF